MSSSLEYRDRERQRKRESRRQASQAQRERERQRARERRRNCSDEQREREQGRNRERRHNFTDEQREREQERSRERRRNFTEEQLDNERERVRENRRRTIVISQIQTPSRSCGTVAGSEIFQDIFRVSTTITIAVGYFHSGWRYSSRIQPHTDSGIETEVVNDTFSIKVSLIPEMIWNQKQQKNVKRKCKDNKESHNIVLLAWKKYNLFLGIENRLQSGPSHSNGNGCPRSKVHLVLRLSAKQTRDENRRKPFMAWSSS